MKRRILIVLGLAGCGLLAALVIPRGAVPPAARAEVPPGSPGASPPASTPRPGGRGPAPAVGDAEVGAPASATDPAASGDRGPAVAPSASRAPISPEMAREIWSRARTDHAGLEAVRRPDGTVFVDFKGRFQSVPVAQVDEAGRVTVRESTPVSAP